MRASPEPPAEEDVAYIDAATGWRASVFAQSPEAVTVSLFAHDGDYMGQWHGEPRELARWRREIARLAVRIITMAETIDGVARDIWAYVALYDLPYNAVYDTLTRLGVPRERQRVSSWAGTTGSGYGRFAVLKAGWPDLYQRFADAFPRIKEAT